VILHLAINLYSNSFKKQDIWTAYRFFFSQKEKGLQLYDLYLIAESEYILCSKQFKYLTKPDQAIGFGDKGKRRKEEKEEKCYNVRYRQVDQTYVFSFA